MRDQIKCCALIQAKLNIEKLERLRCPLPSYRLHRAADEIESLISLGSDKKNEDWIAELTTRSKSAIKWAGIRSADRHYKKLEDPRERFRHAAITVPYLVYEIEQNLSIAESSLQAITRSPLGKVSDETAHWMLMHAAMGKLEPRR